MLKTTFLGLLLTVSFILTLQAKKSQPSKTKTVQIVMLGDSLTEGLGVEAHEAYPALVQSRFDQSRVKVKIINAGVSGSTSSSAFRRLKWYKRIKPEILFLALGANDGLRGQPTEKLFQNLQRAVVYAKEQGMKVILAGTRLPPNLGKKYIQDYVGVFPRLAKEHNLPLLPFLLDQVGGEIELNQADGIHPNVEGHKKIAEGVYSILKETLEGQSQSNQARVSGTTE